MTDHSRIRDSNRDTPDRADKAWPALWRSPRTAGHLTVAATCLSLVASCSWPSDPVGDVYIWEMETPRAIGEWALAEDSCIHIVRAVHALGDYALEARDEEYISYIVKIHDKVVRGWDGLDYSGRQRTDAQLVLRQCYNQLARNACWSTASRAAFCRARPSDSAEDQYLLDEWNAEATKYSLH